MSLTALAPLMSSEDTTWRTPQNVLELVRKVGPIWLDPATSPGNPCGAGEFYTEETNGLAQSWGQGGLVYCNPPYGRAIKPWAAKFREEWNARTELLVLVPARTDTAWWQDNIPAAFEVCFWRGRLTFVGAKNPAPFPSALAYRGPRRGRFREVFGPHGWLVSL